jgi:hypothetical protein
MIDLDEIERRIPSRATECAYCYRLATLVCPVCGTMVCEDHRDLAAREAISTDCEGVAMIPAHHAAATMDRVALVAEVRRLRAALVEVDRHIGCLSQLAAGRACEVITRALYPDGSTAVAATLDAGPRDADGREVTP